MSGTLPSGHTYAEVTGEEGERLKAFKMYNDGGIMLQPGNWIFTKGFQKNADSIYNFKIKPSDIFVVAIPKSGIHWMQEIVWNIVHNPDLDNPDANVSLGIRCPFYEIDFFFDVPGIPPLNPNGEIMKKFNKLYPGKNPSEGVFLHLAASAPEPRLIKNHLACPLLPPNMFKKSKVIYLARDPRDVIVSFYHFTKVHMFLDFNGTLEDFVEDYINDRVVYGPHWEHVRLAWEKRNDPNFLFVFYEDLKANPNFEVKKISEFLGANRTDKQIDNIVQFTSFSNMKERMKDNVPTSYINSVPSKDSKEEDTSYFRKGQVGSWREDLSPELEEKVNAWMRTNLSNFGDDFKYKQLI